VHWRPGSICVATFHCQIHYVATDLLGQPELYCGSLLWLILAYFPYFSKRKRGLWDHLAVCVSPLTNFECGRSGKLLLAFASTVILGSWSRGNHGHIFLSHASESLATLSFTFECSVTWRLKAGIVELEETNQEWLCWRGPAATYPTYRLISSSQKFLFLEMKSLRHVHIILDTVQNYIKLSCRKQPSEGQILPPKENVSVPCIIDRPGKLNTYSHFSQGCETDISWGSVPVPSGILRRYDAQ
jgi:hypothetical protein